MENSKFIHATILLCAEWEKWKKIKSIRMKHIKLRKPPDGDGGISGQQPTDQQDDERIIKRNAQINSKNIWFQFFH